MPKKIVPHSPPATLNPFGECIQSVSEMLGLKPGLKEFAGNTRNQRELWSGEIAEGKHRYLAEKLYKFLKGRAEGFRYHGGKVGNTEALERLGSEEEFIERARLAAVELTKSEVKKGDENTEQPLIRMPYLPLGEKFIGRQSLIKTLIRELTAANTDVNRQPTALWADGGIGKTALTIELGYKLHDAKSFVFVFFLDSSTPQTLETELASLCNREWLSLIERNAPEQKYRQDAALAWLARPKNGKRTFVILDSADSDEARAVVRRLLPSLRSCTILITSRHKGWQGTCNREVALFTPREARDYLHSRLGAQFGTLDEAVIDGIATAVDHLPLALEIVASYIIETRQFPNEWLEEWQSSPVSTLKFHDSDVIDRYPVSLDRVWEQSVSRLSPGARGLLEALAFIAPRPALFPLNPLQEGEGWIDQRGAFMELAKASLVTWPHESNAVSIHRILQTVTRSRLDEARKEAALQMILGLTDFATPAPDWSELGWQLWRELAPHIQMVLGWIESIACKQASARLMGRYGNWLFLQGNFSEAERWHREALRFYEESLKSNDVQLAQPLRNLGEVLYATGRPRESEALHSHALSLLEALYGRESPELLESLTSVITCRVALKSYDQCKSLIDQFRDIFEREVAAEDLRRPRFMFNIAGWMDMYAGTTHLREALYREVIELDSRWPERDAYYAAQRLACFSDFLRVTGHVAEAELVARRALEAVVKFVGPEHNRSALCMNLLARVLCDLEKYSEAEEYHHRSMMIREKTYGVYHIDIMQDLLGLVNIALEKNDLPEAEHLSKRALKIDLRHHMSNKIPFSSSQASAFCHVVLMKKGMSEKEISKWADVVAKKAIREFRLTSNTL